MRVVDVLHLIDGFAPFDSQADFDCSGLQVGDPEAEVSGVLVAVDLTPSVIDEAKRAGCNLIVTHHPAIWGAIATVREDDYTGRLVRTLVRENLHYIAAHTNVDNCAGGNSERLVALLGGEVTGRLSDDDYAVTFRMPTIKLSELLAKVQSTLCDPTAYMVGEDDLLTEGALCTGAGASDSVVKAVCFEGRVLLTGEFKHHQLRYAEQQRSFNLLRTLYERENICYNYQGTFARRRSCGGLLPR